MTIPAKYTLTEAHFHIADLERALREIQDLVVLSNGEPDSYDGTANPVIAKICERAVGPKTDSNKAG